MSDALLSDEDVGLGAPSSSTPASGALLSDSDVGLASAPTNSTATDIARSAAEGVVSGVSGLVGLPGDISRGADYGMLWAEGKGKEALGLLPKGQTASSYAQQQVAAMDTARGGLGLPTSGSLKQAEDSTFGAPYQPQTTAGKYAQTVGSFVPSALAMPFDGPAAIGANVLKYGVIPGVASEAAGQATEGTSIEPYARAAAALGTGMGADAISEAGSAAWNAGKNFMAPTTEEGQQALAAARLRSSFTDPDAASAALNQADQNRNSPYWNLPGAALGEVVPGSKPTTGQLTGDLGALSLERELATKQSDLYKSNQFGTGAEQQNAARTAALDGVQPKGSPEAVGDLVRQQMADIETQHDTAASGATAAAQKSASGIGTGAAPEDIGANLRTTLQGARDSAKTQERQLWNAVDPDGTLALPATPVSSAANDIASSIPGTAKPMAGEEAAIFDTAANLPAVAPFGDITALRSRVSSAMRQELMQNGSSPSYARLSQLRASVEDAITNAVTHKAAVEHSAVANGEMAPAGTLRAKLDDILGAQAGPESGQDVGSQVARTGTGGPSGGAAQSGAGGQGARRSGNPAGGQAVSGNVAGDPSQVSPLGAGKVYYPSGSLDVNYEVANLPDLVTSHDANFRVNKAYPAELQPRVRESAPARDQVNSMASRLQPERLGASPEANSGAPIVGPDNVVESGNGRTLAIGKAYQAGRAGDYRNWLESQGIDTAGIPTPVLVARRVTPLSPEDRVAFAHSANTASGLRMNAAEQAAADARLITPDGLSSIADGSAINSAENRTFVRSFLSQLPASERGGLLDAGGNLSQAGVRRMEAAMASRAYGDGEFVAKAFDAADPNIRGLAGGLTDASGSWMKMRQLAREGTIDPEHDVTPDLMNAARAIMRARDAGRPVSEVLNQTDMFGGEASRLARGLVLNDKGAVASRDQIAAQLRKYAENAQKNLAGPSLFGDTISPAQVLKTSVGEQAKTAAQEPEMVSTAMKGPPAANMDDAAAARLKAASAATKARASTFDSGPVGDALRKGSSASEYRAPDSSLPNKFFATGPSGAERIEAFRDAAGFSGPPNMNPLHDTAAESLRREAMTPDGMIDPGKFATWQAKHQDALRALPASLSAKFSKAASAADAVTEAAAARKQAIDTYQKSVAGKFLGLSAPADITKTVSGIFGTKPAVRDMSALARKVAGNPEAKEGLRKAVADTILAKSKGTTEAGASGINNLNASTFQKFLRENAATIKAAGFSDRELGSMQAVAQDMQRSQRTLSATRLPGQSNTAQDIIKSLEKAHGGHSLLTEMMVGMGAGFEAGGLHGAALGAAGVMGKNVIGGMRDAGIAKANTLVRDAMLNPELAATLLKRAPIKPGRGAAQTLTNMMVRNSMFGAATTARGPSRTAPAN